MKVIEAHGKTLDEAIQSGLAQAGLSRENADIQILDEASKGFLGFGAKPARVLITEKLKRVSMAEEEARLAGERKIQAEIKENNEKKAREIREKQEAATKQQAQQRLQPKEPAATAKPAAITEEPRRKPQPQQQQKPSDAKEVKEAKERPQQQKQAPAAAGGRPRPKAKPSAPSVRKSETGEATPLSEEAKNHLNEIFSRMGVSVEITAFENSNGIYLNAAGSDAGSLIGYRGETLDALQYLVSLKLNKGENDYHRVSLDAEDYRAKREDILIKLANRLAGKAIKTGRKVSLEPMNPYERRILHSALQGHSGVRTHSEGVDPFRRVVITPKRAQFQQGRPVEKGERAPKAEKADE